MFRRMITWFSYIKMAPLTLIENVNDQYSKKKQCLLPNKKKRKKNEKIKKCPINSQNWIFQPNRVDYYFNNSNKKSKLWRKTKWKQITEKISFAYTFLHYSKVIIFIIVKCVFLLTTTVCSLNYTIKASILVFPLFMRNEYRSIMIHGRKEKYREREK